MMRTSALLIRTPEGIVFAQALASPMTRFFAWAVDAACIFGLLMVLGTVLSLLRPLSADLAGAASTLSWFVASIGYGIAGEWFWRGQTVGKRLFRLRVVDAEGMRLQFNQIVTRNLLRFVDALPLMYFVGGAACWLSPKCQRLGDLAANTVVVLIPRLAEPDLDQILAGKFNSLRLHPHLAARLRQRVSPAEAALALQAVLRRDEFEASSRVPLFAELAAHFRSKVDFPAEATDGLADEQFLRNVVDVVFQNRPDRAPV
jgi:uncharacterized RDD family membrane protein YckC